MPMPVEYAAQGELLPFSLVCMLCVPFFSFLFFRLLSIGSVGAGFSDERMFCFWHVN
jgi:hypothetical protein